MDLACATNSHRRHSAQHSVGAEWPVLQTICTSEWILTWIVDLNVKEIRL
jgi:hypothetical protein